MARALRLPDDVSVFGKAWNVAGFRLPAVTVTASVPRMPYPCRFEGMSLDRPPPIEHTRAAQCPSKSLVRCRSRTGIRCRAGSRESQIRLQPVVKSISCDVSLARSMVATTDRAVFRRV